MKTRVKFLHENATFKKAYPTDSGYDLTACDYEYKGNGLWHIKLGVAVQPPEGYYFEVVPRSSFSKTPFILPNNIGIIDMSYRGEWLFPVRHLGAPYWNVYSDLLRQANVEQFCTVEKEVERLTVVQIQSEITKHLLNKRIAQAVLRKYYDSEIEIVDELNETDRGANGFGSSGV